MKYFVPLQLCFNLGVFARSLQVRQSNCALASVHWQKITCQPGFKAYTCFDYDAAKEVANNCVPNDRCDATNYSPANGCTVNGCGYTKYDFDYVVNINDKASPPYEVLYNVRYFTAVNGNIAACKKATTTTSTTTTKTTSTTTSTTTTKPTSTTTSTTTTKTTSTTTSTTTTKTTSTTTSTTTTKTTSTTTTKTTSTTGAATPAYTLHPFYQKITPPAGSTAYTCLGGKDASGTYNQCFDNNLSLAVQYSTNIYAIENVHCKNQNIPEATWWLARGQIPGTTQWLEYRIISGLRDCTKVSGGAIPEGANLEVVCRGETDALGKPRLRCSQPKA